MNRKKILGLGLALIVVAGVRLVGLSGAPLFNDEAIYLDWGRQMIGNRSSNNLASIDGKPPLMLWLFGWAQRWGGDPIVAGRLVSGGLGILACLGVLGLILQGGNLGMAVLVMLMYGLQPLAVF